MENNFGKKHRNHAGILAKLFLGAAVIAASGNGSAFANETPDGPADCPAVGDVCDDGTIYVGSRELNDRDGAALGDFYLFAVPQDLADDRGNRLLLKFNDTVEHVAGLRDWHGHLSSRLVREEPRP